MKRYYEIVSIFKPTISEEKLQNDIKKIKNIINAYNGEIISEENWGNKKLAYEINKCANGIYHFILCDITKFSFVDELKKFYATNEDILRYGIKKVNYKKTETDTNANKSDEISFKEKPI